MVVHPIFGSSGHIYLNYFYSTKVNSDVNDTTDNQVTNRPDLLL